MGWEVMMFLIDNIGKILAICVALFFIVITTRQLKNIWDEKRKTFKIKEMWVNNFSDGPNRDVLSVYIKILSTNPGKTIYPEFAEIKINKVKKRFTTPKKEGIEYDSTDVILTPFSNTYYKEFIDKEVEIRVIDTFGRPSKPVKGVFKMGYIFREKEFE
jgi:hypothetical protein